MSEEWWLKAAILNDKIVADLLLHLKHSSPSSSSFLCKYLPPSWGLRQLRSRPSTSSLSENNNNKLECRRSPTTPLSSWPPSQCSDSPPPHLPSSKISAGSDTLTTLIKSFKRKKIIHSNSLSKEQTYLKKEEQRSINEKLKRIKLDLKVESGIKPEENSDPAEQNTNLSKIYEASSSSIYTPVRTGDASVHLYSEQKGASSQAPVFVLPDLNMSPNEECVHV